MKRVKSLCCALLLAIALLVPQAAQAQTNPCADFAVFSVRLIVDAVGDDLRSFLELLSANVADINGSFDINDRGSSLVITLFGNDIRDATGEMAIIAEMIKSPNTYAGRDLVHTPAEVQAAYTRNFEQIKKDIGVGPEQPNLAGIIALVPQLPRVFTFYSLLGSPDDTSEVPDAEAEQNPDDIAVFGTGAFGILKAIFALLGPTVEEEFGANFANQDLDPATYTFLTGLQDDADMDKDGASNLCEALAFGRKKCDGSFDTNYPGITSQGGVNNIDFVKAALDPTIVPVGCFEVAEEDDCRIEMLAANVKPNPSASTAFGQARFRRFVNNVTGEERYVLNFLHTLETPSDQIPKVQIRLGGPDENATAPFIDLGQANPANWEIFLTVNQVEMLQRNQTYISIFLADGTEQLRGNITCGIVAPPPPVPHDADTNQDFFISETEVQAVFELAGQGGYSCDVDGFQAGTAGGQNCEPHDLDYLPQDWKIELPELLRLVQLSKAPNGYVDCSFYDDTAEDGYCIELN
ncbi:MAG: hypothetical protein GC168_16535 [Candidatus Hydrogenedens sp.]|nr:hypothetical protein [Candidatus Hydrogenedens sp.]